MGIVAVQSTDVAAYMLLTRCTGTTPEGTSASGAVRRRMALAAYISRPVARRSRKSLETLARRKGDLHRVCGNDEVGSYTGMDRL